MGLAMQYASALGPDASYEEVCRAHTAAFISAAAAAETQTALGARVSDWRHKIGPILEQQVGSSYVLTSCTAGMRVM